MNLYQKAVKKANDIFHTYAPLFSLSPPAVECPFCGWKGKSFLPNGVDVRQNSRCPKCDSLERHRMYYLYLKENLPADSVLKTLHFAPEKIMTGLFNSMSNIDYLSADLNPAKAMIKQDITDITFPDATFDFILCSHVLEHVPDDHKAMTELYRVLKPTGFAILQVPIRTHFNERIIDSTYEDFSITDPKDREKVFGQHDHVRIYGKDYKERLERAGFTVRLDKFIERIGPEMTERFALLPQHKSATETEGWIYYCTK